MKTHRTRDKVWNFLLYQGAWFLCIFLAARGLPGVAAAVTLFAVGIHLAMAVDPASELRLVAVAGFVGLLVDSFNLSLGIYRFGEAMSLAWLCPPWIVAMWMLFAITLRSCMGWVTQSLVVAAVVGFVGGPISFLAGERLGAVTFLDPRPIGVLSLGLVWAATLPLLAWFVARESAARELSYRSLAEVVGIGRR